MILFLLWMRCWLDYRMWNLESYIPLSTTNSMYYVTLCEERYKKYNLILEDTRYFFG